MRLVCSLLVAIASTAASLDQTFRSRAEGVRVDVLVMQNGHPVRDLRAADFELRDEGVPQKIALADVDKIPLNVVLVLDSSAQRKLQKLSGRAGLISRSRIGGC